MEEVVATRLSRDLLEKIDLLVERGLFKSRSDVIRNLISSGIEEYLGQAIDQIDLLYGETTTTTEELRDLSKKVFDKPINELISEMRE